MKHRAIAFAAALAAASGLATPSSAQDHPAWPEQAKPMVRFIEEVWNKGDYTAVPDLFAPDAALVFRGHSFPAGPHAGSVVAVVQRWRTGFPDFHFTIEDVLVDHGEIAMRLTFTGTNTGPFLGPATGKPIKVSQMMICEVKAGRLGHCWEEFDDFDLRQQLGLIPKPAAPVAGQK